MSSATLTFAQTDHCDITETILCCWEVANPSKAKGKNQATVACERYLEYSYLHEETISPDHHEGTKSATPYDQYAGRANNINFSFMRDQNQPPPLKNTLIAGHQLRANVQVAANNFKHVKMSKQGHKIRPLQYQRCHVQNPMKIRLNSLSIWTRALTVFKQFDVQTVMFKPIWSDPACLFLLVPVNIL